MLNRIRLRISNFISKHKGKIKDFGQKLIMVAMIVFIATIVLSGLSNVDNDNSREDIYNVYKPTETIIKGSDISKEQFEKDSNLVNTFLDFCNNGEIESAYNLISDECKNEKYPTIEDFKKYYYNYIFEKKRECNLQAWISENNYTVYKVRYSNNMLATGTYDETDVYEDYITLKIKENIEKISIGNFIDSQKCNIITKTNGIEATVAKKKTYIDEEEYEIYIKNNTDKTILLDNLKSNSTIWLIGKNVQYRPHTNKLYISDLTIEPGKTNKITLKVIKNLSSENKSDYIQFKKVITDYDTYLENVEGYNGFVEIRVNVEE